MDLKPAVASTRTELIRALNLDGSFTDWARGRLAPVDRFLSNFHKPLQRRMLFSDPTTELPESGVIQVAATGEIYLIGESREDSRNDQSFDRLTVLHLVSSDSSGLCEYFNYREDLAVPESGDIGRTLEGSFYISVEYMSSKSMESGDEAYQGKFVAYAQNTAPFSRDGVFSLHGKHYKVVQTYLDSGYSCAILLEQPDDMQPVVCHIIDESASGYDVSSGTLLLNTVPYTYAGTVDHVRQDPLGHKHYSIYLKTTNVHDGLGVGTSISLANGESVKVQSIVTDVNTQGQTYLDCEGG